MLDNGKMVNNMVLEYIIGKMEHSKRENGNMGLGSDGLTVKLIQKIILKFDKDNNKYHINIVSYFI